MAAKQAMKENLECTSKYGHLRISQDICHVRMTDIEGFLTTYGHSDNLLNNNVSCPTAVFFVTISGQVSNVSPTFLRNSHLFPQIPDHIPIFSHIFPKVPSYSQTFLGIPRNF